MNRREMLKTLSLAPVALVPALSHKTDDLQAERARCYLLLLEWGFVPRETALKEIAGLDYQAEMHKLTALG